MNPTNNQSSGRSGNPSHPSYQPRTTTPPPRNYSTQRTAAAQLIRKQLDSIYRGQPPRQVRPTSPASQRRPYSPPQATAQHTVPRPQPAQPAQPSSPHQNTQPPARPVKPSQQGSPAGVATQAAQATTTRSTAAAQQHLPTQPPSPAQPTPAPQSPQVQQVQDIPTTLQRSGSQHTPHATAEQWRQYHTAWQKYYQMYYERYYANHLSAKEKELAELAKAQATQPDPAEETAIKKLRAQIRQKVKDGARKATASRHFIPVLTGLTVLVVLLFLQYNRIIFGAVAAYTTPGNIDPQNIIVDPTNNVAVAPEPRIIIPKINVDAPVVYGAGSDEKSQMKAMEKGIAHFAIAGASAVPGQVGNAVFAAHSSNDAFAAGDYKFVFAQNEKLAKGDLIYMNYEGKRYTYSITSTEVVLPDAVSKVQLKTTKPMLTLVSCVPLGTAEKRLLVFAEQISPDPSKAAPSTNTTSDTGSSKGIPGKPNQTVIERLFHR